MLFTGHQETLFPLFNALGKYRVSKVPTGAAIFFEFFTDESLLSSGETLVKIIYKSSASHEQTIWIDQFSE